MEGSATVIAAAVYGVDRRRDVTIERVMPGIKDQCRRSVGATLLEGASSSEEEERRCRHTMSKVERRRRREGRRVTDLVVCYF